MFNFLKFWRGWASNSNIIIYSQRRIIYYWEEFIASWTYGQHSLFRWIVEELSGQEEQKREETIFFQNHRLIRVYISKTLQDMKKFYWIKLVADSICFHFVLNGHVDRMHSFRNISKKPKNHPFKSPPPIWLKGYRRGLLICSPSY